MKGWICKLSCCRKCLKPRVPHVPEGIQVHSSWLPRQQFVHLTVRSSATTAVPYEIFQLLLSTRLRICQIWVEVIEDFKNGDSEMISLGKFLFIGENFPCCLIKVPKCINIQKM